MSFLKNYKLKIRSYSFFILVCISYFFSIFYLFWAHDVLASIVCVFFLYIFFHFLSLDYRKLKIIHAFLFMLSLSFINIILFYFLSWDINIWLIISVFLFNFSLFSLFYSLDIIEFSSISYFLKWGYIFTLFITITYSFALIWMFRQFPFTCEWLKDASNKLVNFVERPFLMPAKKIKETVDLNNQKKIESDLVDEKVENIILWVKSIEISADSGSALSPIIGRINTWKGDIIDQVILDQESYSQGMCNMLLEEINTKYMLKEFWLSAVVLIYLLLFGFVRLSFFIMSFIWFLMFKLLYLTWVYEIKKIQKEVKEIK